MKFVRYYKDFLFFVIILLPTVSWSSSCKLILANQQTSLVSYPERLEYRDIRDKDDVTSAFLDLDDPLMRIKYGDLSLVDAENILRVERLKKEHRRKFVIYSKSLSGEYRLNDFELARYGSYSFVNTRVEVTPEIERKMRRTPYLAKDLVDVVQTLDFFEIDPHWLDPLKVPKAKFDRKRSEEVTFRLTRKEDRLTTLESSYSVPVTDVARLTNIKVKGQGILAEIGGGALVSLFRKDALGSMEALRRELYLQSIGARSERIFVTTHNGVPYWGSEIMMRAEIDFFDTLGVFEQEEVIDRLMGLDHMPTAWVNSLVKNESVIDVFFPEDINYPFMSIKFSPGFKFKFMNILNFLSHKTPLFYMQSADYKSGFNFVVDKLMPQLVWYIDARTGFLGLSFQMTDISETDTWITHETRSSEPRLAAEGFIAPYNQNGRNFYELIRLLSILDPDYTVSVFDHFLEKKKYKEWWLLVSIIKKMFDEEELSIFATENIRIGAEKVFRTASLSGLNIANFKSPSDLSGHFGRHQKDFLNQPDSELEYLSMAVEFITDEEDINSITIQRKDGNFLKYDPDTREFAVINSDGKIITYYILKPDSERDSNMYLGKDVQILRGGSNN